MFFCQLSDGFEIGIVFKRTGTSHRKTICTLRYIVDPENPTEYDDYVAESACHSSDRFVKETGRVRALRKAMEMTEFLTKEDRAVIWNCYHTRGGTR